MRVQPSQLKDYLWQGLGVESQPSFQAVAAAAAPVPAISTVSSSSAEYIKPEGVLVPAVYPAPTPASVSRDAPFDTVHVKSERVEIAAATASASDNSLNETVTRIQQATNYYYNRKQEAPSCDPVAGSIGIRKQKASGLSPMSHGDTHRSFKRREELVKLQELKKQKLILEYLQLELRPGPMTREELQCDEPTRIGSISPAGRVENASHPNESQKKQRSRKRHRRAREELLELQELKMRKLMLENLKLELELELITHEGCTERRHSVVEMFT